MQKTEHSEGNSRDACDIIILSNRNIEFYITPETLQKFRTTPANVKTNVYKFEEPHEVDNTIILRFATDYFETSDISAFENYSLDIVISVHIFAGLYHCETLMQAIEEYLTLDIFPEFQSDPRELRNYITRDLFTNDDPRWFKLTMR